MPMAPKNIKRNRLFIQFLFRREGSSLEGGLKSRGVYLCFMFSACRLVSGELRAARCRVMLVKRRLSTYGGTI
eukprot:scaffold3742_cov267-Chaetoceros_neogracile.AAC.3